jgi:hypothetical protein
MWPTIVVGALVFGLIALALLKTVKNYRSGGCGCGCDGCGKNCREKSGPA